MKRRTFTFFLIIIVICGTTACTYSDNTTSTTGTEVLSTESSTSQLPSNGIPTETINLDLPIEITYLPKSVLSEMDTQDLDKFYFDMVQISELQELSLEEIETIAQNLHNIYRRCPAFEKDSFNEYSFLIFSNILQQVTESHIPLDMISAWTNVPAVNVLYSFFSQTNFEVVEHIGCEALYLLDTSGIHHVAEAFFSNPVMSTNSHIPALIISLETDEWTIDMAWQHLEELSKTDAPKSSLSSAELTENFCYSLMRTLLDNRNIEKVVNIVEYILTNPYYDINIKYKFFCNAFYNFEKNEYTDASIAFRAIDSLLILAKSEDEHIRSQLIELLDNLNNTVAEALSDALGLT